MRHSYTKVSMYMECPAKKRYRYDQRLPTPVNPAAARGTEYHSQLESSINGAPPNDELSFYHSYITELRSRGAVAEFAFALRRDWTITEWDAADCWLLGKADVWVPSVPLAHVQDWKTGKIYDSHEKQGEFYSTALFSYVPEAYEVKATFIYTDLKKERSKTYHRDMLESLRSRWTARIERMERDTVCAPTPTWFGCKFCPFSKAKGGPCHFGG